MKKILLLLVIGLFCVKINAQLTIDSKSSIVDIKQNVEKYSWEEINDYINSRTLSFKKDGWLYTLSYDPLEEDQYTEVRFEIWDEETQSIKFSDDILPIYRIKKDSITGRYANLYGTKYGTKPVQWIKSTTSKNVSGHPRIMDVKWWFDANRINTDANGNSFIERLSFGNYELILMVVCVNTKRIESGKHEIFTEMIIFYPHIVYDNGFIDFCYLKFILKPNSTFEYVRREGNKFYEKNGNWVEITYHGQTIEWEYYNAEGELIKWRKKNN